METRHIEEQAEIILDHLRSDQVDTAFILRHAEALLTFAFSANMKPVSGWKTADKGEQRGMATVH
jgi:hypothetical protein